MPELPEAETIARQLQRELAGRTLGDVHLARTDIVHGDPAPLGELLPGRRVVRVYRRAKQVVLELAPPVQLVFRLGMTGRLTVIPADAETEPHTHFRATVAETGCELRFRDPRRFGGIWVLREGSDYVGRRLGEVGIEPLDATVRQFREVLSRRRQIKALLLDQTAIAGLGNIYCDESLHAAGIHPLTPAESLAPQRAARLLRTIKSTLRRAIRFNGSTLMDYRDADGREGSFQRLHRVYQREGKPCKTCKTPIRRIIAAGRSTFFCPRCQPEKAHHQDTRTPRKAAKKRHS
jgi:formamidopyrimidine-DNA glycosylase